MAGNELCVWHASFYQTKIDNVNICSVFMRGIRVRFKLILSAFIMAVCSAAFAQCSSRSNVILDKPISINLERENLREALSSIEQEAGVKFMFHSQVISASEEVTLHADQVALRDVLSQVLGPRKIQFEVDGNQIILTKNLSLHAD